jgi:hypothetical protein
MVPAVLGKSFLLIVGLLLLGELVECAGRLAWQLAGELLRLQLLLDPAQKIYSSVSTQLNRCKLVKREAYYVGKMM